MIAAVHRWRGFLYIFAVALSGAGTLHAQPVAVPDTAKQTRQINPVVITASYGDEHLLSTPATVTIITSKDLEMRGATNLTQALAQESGIRLAHDAILGSSMSLNGINGQNVKVLVDGLPVIGRLNGNLDLSQVLLANVNRIELVEGPLSVNYGTDALGGTINLITRKDQIRRIEATAQTYVESVGQYNMQASLGYKKRRNRCGLVLARNFLDGWSEVDTMRQKEWKPREQYFAQAYYVRASQSTSFEYKADFFNERILNRGNPRPPYFETAFDDWYKTKRLNNAILFSHAFKTSHRLDITAAYNHYERVKNTYFKNLVDLQEQLTANANDQDTARFGLMSSRGTWSITPDSSKVHAQLGYDLQIETAAGRRMEDGVQSISDMALFGSARWKPVSHITFQAGLRGAYNTDYRHPLVPGVNMKIDLKPHLVWRAAYARGFRAPSLKELHFLFVDANHDISGNPDLRAEYSNHLSTNLRWSKALKKTQLVVTPALNFNDIRNLITMAQVSGESFSYVNIGAYKTAGGTLQGFLGRDRWDIQLDLGVTARHADSTSAASPELSARWTYRLVRWNTTLNAYYRFNGTSTAFTVDEVGGVSEQTLAAYHLADATASKSFARSQMVVVAGVKNIFDVTRIATTGGGSVHGSGANQLIAWGRTAFVSLRIKLGYD